MFKWLIAILLLMFVYHVREVFPPFIVGAIIAYLLYPLVKFLNQRVRLAPFWSVLVIYTLTGMIVGIFVWHFWPLVHAQGKAMYEGRHEIVKNLLNQVSTQFGMTYDVDETAELVLNQINSTVGKPEELVQITGVISKSLLSMLVCAVTSVYMLVDSKRVGRFVMRFIPPENRATVVSLAGQMDVMFRKYVLGQLGLISLMSVIAFCILTFFGIKYALLIALVTGFLEIIPVLGPLLAIIIATIFAVAQLGLPDAGWVPLCYWVARLVEDYVIVPNTIGHAVELHPLAVIFAVVVGETMAGALGMLIAIPVAASIKVIIDFCYPSTTVAAQHEHKKNPLSWMIDMFRRPPRPAEKTLEEKAQEDLRVIDSMHSSSSGTGQRIRLEASAEQVVLEKKQPEDSALAETTTPAGSTTPPQAAAPNRPGNGSSKPAQATRPAEANTTTPLAPVPPQGTGAAAGKPSLSTPAQPESDKSGSAAPAKHLEQTTNETTAKAQPSNAKEELPGTSRQDTPSPQKSNNDGSTQKPDAEARKPTITASNLPAVKEEVAQTNPTAKITRNKLDAMAKSTRNKLDAMPQPETGDTKSEKPEAPEQPKQNQPEKPGKDGTARGGIPKQ